MKTYDILCLNMVFICANGKDIMSVLHGKIQKHIIDEASIANKCSGITFCDHVMLEIAMYISCQIMNIFL